MTYDEQKKCNLGIFPEPTSLAIPVPPNAFTPPAVNEFNEGTPTTPKPEDYNNIPLADMEAMHQFRNMDPIHAADAIALEHSKGKTMKAIYDAEGSERFKSRYKKSH